MMATWRRLEPGPTRRSFEAVQAREFVGLADAPDGWAVWLASLPPERRLGLTVECPSVPHLGLTCPNHQAARP